MSELAIELEKVKKDYSGVKEEHSTAFKRHIAAIEGQERLESECNASVDLMNENREELKKLTNQIETVIKKMINRTEVLKTEKDKLNSEADVMERSSRGIKADIKGMDTENEKLAGIIKNLRHALDGCEVFLD